MIYSMEVVREETYCFTPNNGTMPVNILSGRLRKWLHENAMHKIIDLTFPEQTEAELIEQHGLEAPRMASMNVLEASEPVIVGIWPIDNTNILIDGAHRRWFWHKRGVNTIRGWAVLFDVWANFIFNPTAPGVLRHSDDGSELPQRKGR